MNDTLSQECKTAEWQGKGSLDLNQVPFENFHT